MTLEKKHIALMLAASAAALAMPQPQIKPPARVHRTTPDSKAGRRMMQAKGAVLGTRLSDHNQRIEDERQARLARRKGRK